MCGICGYYSKNEINYEQLSLMNDSIRYRGPDDAGMEIFSLSQNYYLGMAHRRLSILDLSVRGHQPMQSPDGKIIVVFNGEIYNYRKLKEELYGYPFKSDCDTEVIIASYLKWRDKGIEGWIEKLDGMFAIALYDMDKNRLILIRDRMGKKPLYYWLENENIVFASELKPIMLCPGFPKKINNAVLKRFLYQQYINVPDTIFQDVYQLEPGSFGIFECGKFQKYDYWDISNEFSKAFLDGITDYREAKANLKKLFYKAVEKRMLSDVPVGCFLSGGYDSSIITAVAQQISSKPVKTFCIGVKDKNLDEAKYAKRIADYLGTNHTELYIDEKEMHTLVGSIPTYFDQPFADSSEIPTMLVSALARTEVTVALSGDGGDELFCGYGSYDYVKTAQSYDCLGAIFNAVGNLGFRGYKLENLYNMKIKSLADNRDHRFKTQVGSSAYETVINNMLCGKEGYYTCKYDMEDRYKVHNWQVKKMLLDMETYLPGDILTKVDRASMKYSLETRCPFLDTEVIRYSFRLPQKFKYYRGDKKHILKEIAYDFIPKDLLERPKQGFSIPCAKWLTGELREQLEEYSSVDYLKKQGIFEAEYTYNFIHKFIETGDFGVASGKNFSRICWPFFVFQQWYEAYMY